MCVLAYLTTLVLQPSGVLSTSRRSIALRGHSAQSPKSLPHLLCSCGLSLGKSLSNSGTTSSSSGLSKGLSKGLAGRAITSTCKGLCKGPRC